MKPALFNVDILTPNGSIIGNQLYMLPIFIMPLVEHRASYELQVNTSSQSTEIVLIPGQWGSVGPVYPHAFAKTTPYSSSIDVGFASFDGKH